MLEPIGLDERDEAVYDALIRRTRATAAELAADCGLTPGAAGRVLRSLVGLGLASAGQGRPVSYAAVPPDSALEAVLREREQALNGVRAHVSALTSLYRAGSRFAHPGDLVEVVSGREEVNRNWVQMQRASRTQVRGFDCPPYAAAAGHSEPNPVELELLARGVKYRVLYDSSVLELPGWLEDVAIGIRLGEQARIATGLPGKLAICDDRVAMLPLLRPGDDTVTASYVIHPSPLLDALVALFETVWERSVQIRPSTPPADVDPPERLSPEEEKLLTLLASGATDKAAGRALGWSERTVQRHITKLLRRFGAQTRFQLAMEATRRGWI
ncbi:helix-turn-helix domain-containing protein [Streptomyces sp. NPDC005908]|uniref:helix-turn-helix transcriptional regulator n=1 Tax=unclassified Streptomyces TaxID=2593676 RepID=UPI0011A5664D|nr:helix-turn-helix domain-containing protein [Streptomyces sp. T12]TWD29625.1 regulatory LuxR family protein [Streptomyces sp. T12]